MSSEGGGGRGRILVGVREGVRRTTEDARAVGGTGGAIGATLDQGIVLTPSPNASPHGSWDPSMDPLTVLVEKGTRLFSASWILVTISFQVLLKSLIHLPHAFLSAWPHSYHQQH